MKFIVTFFFCLTVVFFINGFFLSSPVLAQKTEDWGSRCVVKNIEIVNPGPFKTNPKYDDIVTIQGFECLFYNILQVIVAIAGLVFLFMFISGGYKYLFSGSEQKAVAAASSTLTNAFIGLIGVIASWLILKLIQDFTGINITTFIIPG